MEDAGTNRWPMTGKEYDNMRQVIVAVDELAKAPTNLKKGSRRSHTAGGITG